MGLIEVVVAMMIVAVLSSVAFGGMKAIMDSRAGQAEDGSTEGTTTEEKGEDSTILEDIFGDEREEENEYTEGPGPHPVDKESEGGSWLGLGMLGVFVVLVIPIIVRYFKGLLEEAKEAEEIDIVYEAHQAEEEEEAGSQLRFTGSVERYLDDMRELLGNRLTRSDIDKLRSVLMCAKVFDSMKLNGGETLSRISDIYIPAINAAVERIMQAPSQTIVASLTPYLHRALVVLREAMEYELNAYQKRAVQEIEAEVVAVERMSAMKNDTDDFDGIALHL